MVSTRSRIDLLYSLPMYSVGAELGVFCGEFSDHILNIVKPARLYLVDTFEGIVVSGDADGNNAKQRDMGRMYYELRQRMFGKAVVVMESAFTWLSAQPANYLDWVYIDTDHSIESTMVELAAALPAVKKGGFICGHDYAPGFPGVVQAVDLFCKKHKLIAEIWDGDKLPSYKIQKV